MQPATERFKFTKTDLLKLELPPQGKRKTVYDSQCQKLALRTTAAGAKTFYVVKRTGAAMTWLKLGSFPEMTVEQARNEAAKVLGEFASGANPAEARRAIREQMTFGDIFASYLIDKKKRDGTTLTAKTRTNYSDVLRLYLDKITGKKLAEISRDDLKAIHAKASKKSHAQADRAVRIVSAVFNFAGDLGLFDGINPAARIQKNPAVERDRFVQRVELPHLFDAIATSAIGDFFLLSLLTGARRSNVQEMAWHDIDQEAGIWRIGMTKNGTPQNVTLSPEALATLKARKQAANGSPFVFPGTGKTGHLVEPKTSWATILNRATTCRLLEVLDEMGQLTDANRQQAVDLLAHAPAHALEHCRSIAEALKISPLAYDMTDIRIHDLRRTLGSWQAKTGASLVIIGKSLNHKTTQSTRIYARLDDDPVRQSVNTATSAMMAAGGQKKSAEVLNLRPRGTR
ncbi:tyrosine-type recombinase/integrase [Pseudomonas vranovensis]|uniref:tyrosine-type recombinase/integrase n=1 Tax=Pseudomonas vranovensis TaxID=321661 RepID=UPI0004294F20|nr:site-specific integrase [Pseudomonas vranovensis]